MPISVRGIMPYEGDEDYIFISYSHKDSAKVLPLLERLYQNGYRIWFDEGIDPGTEWPESIASHLAGCRACLAFISPNTVDSVNCRREINYALSKHKGFLSVLLEPTDMSPGMEMQLSSYQSVLSYKYPSMDSFISRLFSIDLLKTCRDESTYRIKSTDLNENDRNHLKDDVNEKKTPIADPEQTPADNFTRESPPVRVSTTGLMIWSIIVTLISTIPGIIAIIKTSKINSCATVEEQNKTIKAARGWCIAGTILGVLLLIGLANS